MIRNLKLWRNLATGVFFVAIALGGVLVFQSSSLSPRGQSERLKDAFFTQDFERGAAEGRAFVKGGRPDVETAAWLVLNEARAGFGRKAEERARALRQDFPRSPWSSFALAGALMMSDAGEAEALAASAEALRADPKRPEFAWMLAETMRLRGHFTEAGQLLESLPRSVRASYLVGTVAGAIEFDQAARESFAPARIERALALFSAAQSAEQNAPLPHYTAGWFLMYAQQPGAARPHLARAASLTNAPRVHRSYWESIQQDPALDEAARRELIESDAARMLSRPPAGPLTMLTASQGYAMLGLSSTAADIQSELAKRYPKSAEAALVEFDGLVRRSQITSESPSASNGQLRVIVARLREVSRAAHYQETAIPLVANETILAIYELYPQFQDPQMVSDAHALAAAAGTAAGYARSAELLARRAVAPTEAERLARHGVTLLDRMPTPRAGPIQSGATSAQRRLRGLLYNALGRALIEQGRSQEGLEALIRAQTADAVEIDHVMDVAWAYERVGDFEQAEQWLIRCAAGSEELDNVCVQRLRAIYERRHPTERRAAAAFANAEGRIREARNARIAAARITSTGDTVDFNLSTLSGARINSESLRGQVVVVAFWGVWCAVCLAELPDFDEVADRISRTTGKVTFLTINDETNIERVRRWVTDEKFRLPVLRGGDLFRSRDLAQVPTVWILDEQGHLAFELIGFSGMQETLLTERVRAAASRSNRSRSVNER